MDLAVVLGIIAGVILVWATVLVLFWLLRPRGVAIRDIIATVPDLLRMIRALIRDRSVAPDVRIVLVGLLVWIISPIDLIPEFIPVLGPLDDVIVAIVALRYVRRRLGVEVLRARWTGSAARFDLVLRAIGGG